jgi:protein-S-isoprenylcysteine O-methyltransferase Ste14
MTWLLVVLGAGAAPVLWLVMRGREGTKLYDIAAGLPLFLFYGWNVWRNWPELQRYGRLLGNGEADFRTVADFLALAVTILFATLLLALLLLRHVPSAKSPNLLSRVAAAAGTFLTLAFLLVPGTRLPQGLAFASTFLIIAGTLATIYAFLWLGKSFSIMPEARALVTRGPYALVRHPAYLFEEITILGIMLQHAQPWSLILFVWQFGCQLVRIHYEEKVLTAAFPEYRAYAAGRARLIPGLY